MPAQSVNAAPAIAALFAAGTVAFETHDLIGADVLLEEEREAVLRAVPKRVHEFAAGRACARAALAQLGYGAVALPIGADRAPRWPEGTTGSITHTDGYCAAVVAVSDQIRALGLDAEPAASVRSHLWRRICTPQELEALQLQDESVGVSAATLIFSAKEAFYKCQHALTGEWLGFADICIKFEDSGFTVHPTRSLQIEQRFPGPWPGRYVRERGLLITGVCII